MKTLKNIGTTMVLGAAVLMNANVFAGGRGDGPTVFVSSQGLFYDSIVVVDSLPMKGEFQQLLMGGISGLETEYGPGDVGHLGGRWWIDVNGNNIQDKNDKYFLCPLLGPGRATL
jgi:hypothetical protein